VIKSRRMKWLGHVAHVGRKQMHRFWQIKPERRNHMENLDINES
jgi:hypothetical protein